MLCAVFLVYNNYRNQLSQLKVKRVVLIEGLNYIIPLLLTRGLNKV